MSDAPTILTVDPVEVAAAALHRGDLAALLAGRIAVQHRYAIADAPAGAAGWSSSDRGLTLAAGGLFGDPHPDNCGQVRRERLAVTAYGPTPYAAAQVWAALRAQTLALGRQAVALPSGAVALLYYAHIIEGPIAGYDVDIRMHTLAGALAAQVAAAPIS